MSERLVETIGAGHRFHAHTQPARFRLESKAERCGCEDPMALAGERCAGHIDYRTTDRVEVPAVLRIGLRVEPAKEMVAREEEPDPQRDWADQYPAK